MNAVESDVEKLVQKELESANQKFPMFRSDHEGAAVIFEEIEKANEECFRIKGQFEVLWDYVKNDEKFSSKLAIRISNCALNLACEAIQVAAMAQKFIDSQKVREKSEQL